MSNFGNDVTRSLLEACHMENGNQPVPVLEYKGYTGSVEWSEEDNLFFGQLLHIRSLISYEGKNAEELSNDFHKAVEGYLDFCKQEGIEPEQPVEQGNLKV